LIVGIVYAGVWWLNLKAAKRLERDRDAWFGNPLVGTRQENNDLVHQITEKIDRCL
jgi:uncharacterized membrane protein YfbV (UPF0208 family)